MSTILVTGGAGFIGSNLCKRLVTEGHNVTSLDNYFTGTEDNHTTGVNYIRGSTRNIKELIKETPDIIFHLGEYSRVEQSFNDIDKVIEFNKLGTLAVVKYALDIDCKLIYAGSSTKFGDNGDNANASPYAWSKASNTDLIKNYGIWFNLNYAIVYFYNVYGGSEMQSGSYATLIGIFQNKISNSEALNVVSPGTQQRNFTHVDDTVDALMLVGFDKNGTGDDFGIGAPEAYTILQVAEMFNAESQTPINMLPERLGNRLTAEVICEKTRKLGWHPKKKLEIFIKDFLNSLHIK